MHFMPYERCFKKIYPGEKIHPVANLHLLSRCIILKLHPGLFFHPGLFCAKRISQCILYASFITDQHFRDIVEVFIV